MIEVFVQSPIVLTMCLFALALLIVTFATSRRAGSRKTESWLLVATTAMTIFAVVLIAVRFLVLKES